MALLITLISLSALLSGTSATSVFGTITSATSAILSGIVEGHAPPEITLDYGTFRGVADAVTGTNNFLGIPFGVAPRFDHAYLFNTTLTGTQDASQYGSSCPQQELVAEFAPHDLGLGALLSVAEAAVLPSVIDQSEDCLNINVQVPSNISSDSKLPVMMWIHGGAYSDGAAAAFAGETTAIPGVFYQCGMIVKRSIDMGMPVVAVSANYRLNAFGLSGGREMEEAGVTNLAIEDQRLAMKWVQKYISQGHHIWESAGSWSVSTQLVAYDGDDENLFHGAIAMSGGVLKVDGQERAQPAFDAMAATAGCNSTADVLDCLRKAPYDALYAAVQEQPLALGYNSLALSWAPRPDGRVLIASPHQLASEGKIANVPVIIGDMKDEGTLFSLVTQLNVTTDESFKEYFQNIWWPNATDAQLACLMELYPADPTQGSPFDTGLANAITPQYKRLAALIGDYSFQSQRRQLIENIPSAQKAWTYLTETSIPVLGEIPLINQLGLADVPALGSFHVSDAVLYTFGTIPASLSRNTRNIMGTMISFAYTLDPNNHGFDDIPEWPEYDNNAKQMYQFSETGPSVIEDTYRQEAMQYINDNAASLGI